MTKKFRALLCAFVAVCGLAIGQAYAQSSQTLDRIKNSGVLRVGVKADYRPFGYLNPSGEIVGLEPDLAANAAEKLGVRLELVPVQTANRIEFLQQGRIDLMIATMSDSEQRRRVVGIIEPYYYTGGTGLLIHKNSGVKKWTDLKEKPICGTQGASYNRPVAQKYKAKIIAFPGIVEAQNALLTGSCVGLVQDSTFIASILASRESRWADYEMPLPVEDMMPWSVAVPLAERETAYGKLISEIVNDWHRSGLLISLKEKWALPVSDFLKTKHAEAKAR